MERGGRRKCRGGGRIVGRRGEEGGGRGRKGWR